MDGELVGDGRVLDIGHAIGRQHTGEDVAVLAGFAGGERRQRSNRQPEIETDAIKMAGTDAGAGQDQHAMLRQQFAQLVHQWEDRLGAAIHDRAAADLDHLQPWQ